MSAGLQPELRLLRPGDVPAVQSVIYRTIDACYTGVYPGSAVAFFKQYHSQENIEQDAAAGRTFVLELGGRIVGVGALARSTIKRVFVDPEFQHRGFGTLIMARLEQEARVLGVTAVDLHASLPSKRLYEFLGYQSGPPSFEEGVPGEKLQYYPMTKVLGSDRPRTGARVLRLVASGLNLVALALAAAIIATKLGVPGQGLLWEDLSLVMLFAAALVSLVCIRPWAQFRRAPPAPLVPVAGTVLNLWFAVSAVLALVRAGEGFQVELFVTFGPLAVMVALNVAVLGFRMPGPVPRWLWPAAGTATAVWAALYGWPLFFAGLLFGVKPAG